MQPCGWYRQLAVQVFRCDGTRDRRPKGISELNLDTGRIYLVPVVIRDETGDGRAFITNEDWMLEKPSKHKWPLIDGRHDFWFQVWSGEHRWRSEYPYKSLCRPLELVMGRLRWKCFMVTSIKLVVGFDVATASCPTAPRLSLYRQRQPIRSLCAPRHPCCFDAARDYG